MAPMAWLGGLWRLRRSSESWNAALGESVVAVFDQSSFTDEFDCIFLEANINQLRMSVENNIKVSHHI